jgi:predicted TPR repeat methyltransferase
MQLCGVDLSAGMVGKARQRGCYDELAVAELVQYLQGRQQGELVVL